MKYFIILVSALVAVSAQRDYTTPVPILKQINKHNEDGSYSYGYEGADGTYKIETKYPNGEVFGKYGYVDDSGHMREIEYGATKRGFEPQGNDINVAPPTIHDNQQALRPLGPNEEDDGQYREDPSVYYKDEKYNQPQPQKHTYTPKYNQAAYQPYQHKQQYQPYHLQQQEPQQQQMYRPSGRFNFDDFFQLSNRHQQQPQYRYNQQPAQPVYNNNYYKSHFAGHPATNVDLSLGSYTVNYR